MAEEVFEEYDNVLLQAMFAAKTVGAQRDRLLRLQRMLQQTAPGGDDATADEVAASLEKVVSDVSFRGLVAGVHYLAVGLKMEAENGATLALNPSFSATSGEQLYDALVAQQLPARPTTRAKAIFRIEAALYAVKLPREYHLPRCIEHLSGKVCDLAKTGQTLSL